MTTLAKTVVATGASSGIGFELIKQLLRQQQPYKFILGARDVATTEAAYNNVEFDRNQHSVAVLPLELSDLKGVKSFSQQVLDRLGQTKLDFLMLNAAMSEGAEQLGPHGSKWCESYIVNHLSQHYLVHLFRDKLVASSSRLVFVSSGAIRMVKDPSTLDTNLKGGSGADRRIIYPESKLAALLGAHWWRRQLTGQCTVVAVSPGLIPGTGLMGRGKAVPDLPPEVMKDAKSIPEGAASILAAFTRSDFPEDPDRIFLTSWGEWWGRQEIAVSLDKALQDKWSPSKEEIEKEEGIPV